MIALTPAINIISMANKDSEVLFSFYEFTEYYRTATTYPRLQELTEIDAEGNPKLYAEGRMRDFDTDEEAITAFRRWTGAFSKPYKSNLKARETVGYALWIHCHTNTDKEGDHFTCNATELLDMVGMDKQFRTAANAFVQPHNIEDWKDPT